MTTYVETSALLAALLEQDAAARQGRLTQAQERRAIRALRTFASRWDAGVRDNARALGFATV